MQKKDIFVSYSTRDREITEQIVKELELCGARCWYAPRDVEGRYAKAICEAIENAKIFLLILSENSAVSEHVLNEVEMAYNKRNSSNHNIIIEPLCIKPLDLDDKSFDEIMYYIRRINFVTPNKGNTPQDFARRVLDINKDILRIAAVRKKERTASLYYTSDRENRRLEIQNQMLRRFDLPVYQKVFARYQEPAILDVGSGDGRMITDRVTDCCTVYKLVGIERDRQKTEQANASYGSEHVRFYQADVEDPGFADRLADIMEEQGIEKFDVINISMLLLHLKSICSLLRKLRRILKPEGTVVIKDIDDGINFAYPDEENLFERVYRICDDNETSGTRRTGRQIYTNLFRAGLRRVCLEKQGLSTVGMTYDEKEDFFNMYFKFILGDIRWMHEKYPDSPEISEDCEWYEENYERIFDLFMEDDFIFSLGFQIYTAQK